MTTDTHATAKRDRQKAARAVRLARDAAQQRRAARLRTVRVALAALAAVAVLGWLGWAAVQGSDPSLGVAAAVVDPGTPALVPAVGGGAVDPAVGVLAPPVEGRTFADDPVRIGGGGQAQAVAFMAHWCPHCDEELPLVPGWVAEGLLPADVQLVAVSTSHDPARPNWPPDEWFAEAGFTAPVLSDPTGAAAEAWGLQGTPMWVFTDVDGRVVARHSGQLTPELFAEGAGLASATRDGQG